jgi:hypothetical protein
VNGLEVKGAEVGELANGKMGTGEEWEVKNGDIMRTSFLQRIAIGDLSNFLIIKPWSIS